MKKLLEDARHFFEKIDVMRDNLLGLLIVPYWPRKITPNHLTIARIIISVVLLVLLFYHQNTNKILLISLFCIGALTDLLDGSVARKLDKETKIGSILDPLADKLLIFPIAIYSLLNFHRWILLLIIVLELTNALIVMYARGFNGFAESNYITVFDKIKMVLQSVVFAGILIFWPHPPQTVFVYLLWFSVYSIILSMVVKIIDINSRPAA